MSIFNIKSSSSLKKNVFILFLLAVIVSIFGCAQTKLIRSVTIIYYANDKQYKSLSFSIVDGSYIKGDPDSWGDKSWKVNTLLGDFGYRDTDGIKYHFWKTGEGADKAYTFYYTSSDREFSTSSPVEHDMVLIPKYTPSNEKAVFTIVHYHSSESKYDASNPKPIYEVERSEYNVLVDFEKTGENQGKYKLDPQILIGNLITDIQTHSDESVHNEVGYGYVDYNNHGHRNVLWSDSPRVLVDNFGNRYVGGETYYVDGDLTLNIEYVDGGYEPIKDYFGYVGDFEPVTLDMVYVPGTTDSEGLSHPWPNSINGQLTSNESSLNADGKVASDFAEYNIPIPNMMVADTPVTVDFIKNVMGATGPSATVPSIIKIKAEDHGEDTSGSDNDDGILMKFVFYNTNDDERYRKAFSQSYGLQGDETKPWNFPNVRQCMVMANFLTALYNITEGGINAPEGSDVGFEPLGYVYLKPDRTPYRDCTRSNVGLYNPVIIDEEANGFRLPSIYEAQYLSKIITDERQLPDFNSSEGGKVKSLFHEKGGVNDYLYYFQSSNEGNFNILTPSGGGNYYYSGSGAPLASFIVPTSDKVNTDSDIKNYKRVKYDSSKLRETWRAIGCEQSSSFPARTRSVKTSYTMQVPSDFHRYTADYNLRNGAGLFHMTGMGYMPTHTFDSVTQDMLFTSSSFDDGAVWRQRIAAIGSLSIENTSADYTDPSQDPYLNAEYLYVSPRFVRTVK